MLALHRTNNIPRAPLVSYRPKILLWQLPWPRELEASFQASLHGTTYGADWIVLAVATLYFGILPLQLRGAVSFDLWCTLVGVFFLSAISTAACIFLPQERYIKLRTMLVFAVWPKTPSRVHEATEARATHNCS